MQTDNRLLDDLARMANGAFGSLHGVRQDVEARLKELFERFAGDMDLVSREEFDAVKAMAAKAREENEALQKRIAELEGRSASTDTAADPGARPTAEDD